MPFERSLCYTRKPVTYSHHLRTVMQYKSLIDGTWQVVASGVDEKTLKREGVCAASLPTTMV